jgi:hypothetical protein
MLIAATVAAALAWTPLPPASLPRREVARWRLKGGVVPGLSLSPTIEFLDVPARQP